MLQKLVGGLLLSGLLIGQTTANPQFSVVGDLIANDKKELSSSGVEIAVQGYVNPFARADVYLHKHNDESPVELEEAVLTIERGLPFGLGLRLGKFRPDLGRINKVHTHLFPFIEAPTGMKKVLGEEFYAGTGLEANWLMPLPWYSNLSIGLFESGIESQSQKKDKEGEGHIIYTINDSDDEFYPEGLKDKEEGFDKVLTLRQSNFFDINEINHIEIGFSFYGDIKNSFGGVDFKYKWRPNKYRSLTIQGEIFQLSCWDGASFGGNDYYNCAQASYLMSNFQFNKKYNIGIIADFWSFDLGKEAGTNQSIFIGFSPVEESSVLRLKIEQVDDGKDKHIRGVAQFIWSLGPHKPHRY
jgi:hypothetical protein